MEKGRLDNLESSASPAATEFNGTKEPVATYKSIPDDDTNWRINNPVSDDKKTVNMGKLNEDVEDDANDKMLNEETKIVAAKEPTEVKFISENGDAKIDIETVKNTLSGMGKEELMKYANDPFWIRLRWLLFIGFWLLWVGMLAGAIAIIVMAPKCSAPQPKKWWEESPIVQLEPRDIEGRDDQSIGSLLDTLQNQYIKVLSLSNFVDANGHTKDFRGVQEEVGSIDRLEAITKAAKSRNQHVVLELDPNHSSLDHQWFQWSVKRDDPWTNYYVWADAKSSGSSGTREPPNNWLSVNGGSAWKWNEERGQFYLHQFDETQPDLNYNNPAVVAEFGDILSHWMDRGVSGFRLRNTRYLTEDPSFRNESRGTVAANADEYQYLTHVHTVDRPENQPILAQWREIVTNRTQGDGLFALSDNIAADILAVYNEGKTLIDIPQSSQFLETATDQITADSLYEGIRQSIETSGGWPSWNLNGNEASLKDRMHSDMAESITLMTLLLPGTPILKLNDTLSASAAARSAFEAVAKSRSTPTFWFGATDYQVVNGTVFIYTRIKSGNPGFLVVYQSGDEATHIDLSKIKSVSSEVSVLAHSSSYGTASKTKLSSDDVPISPKSTLVLTFVPKE